MSPGLPEFKKKKKKIKKKDTGELVIRQIF